MTCWLLSWSLFLGQARAENGLAGIYADEARGAEVVLLVESVSTVDQGSAVSDEVVSILRGLVSGDVVQVLRLGATVEVLQARSPVDEQTLPSLLQTARAWNWVGTKSDLGRGMEALATSLLQAPEALRVVMVVGNLCHQPGPDSPYAFESSSGCAAVKGARDLRESFARDRGSGLILPYVLPGGTLNPRGLRALFQFLGEGTVIPDASDAREAWFSGLSSSQSAER
ncbi:MAG: hypothetical protein QGG40_22515, partial [Myxococcota bacterium]|nr:hypothetical protein [Myxococcota bacterium]